MIKDLNKDWVNKLYDEGILTYLIKKSQESVFKEIFREYLRNLVEIIYRLSLISSNSGSLKVQPFCLELVEDGYDLGLQPLSLIKIITQLIKYLNKNINDFNIRLIELKRVNDDGSLRVCNKCGDKKSYDEFSISQYGANGFTSVCKDCKNMDYAIMQSIKKLDVIDKIYNGKFKNGKCVKCGIDIIFLPCLTFHHYDPSVKKISYRDIADLPSDEIIRLLEQENVKLICFNCQRLIHATLFDRFKYVILDPNLYGYNIREIDEIIIHFKEKYNLEGEVSAVKYWMKKRIVIDYLFNGKCVGCGNINIFNNLACLEFHHTEPYVEQKLRWQKIKDLNIKTIIYKLLNEKCVCLCKNCHKLIDSHQFRKYSIEILGIPKGKLAKNKFQKLANNIQKHNIVKNSDIFPIIIEFMLDKAWKRALLCIYKITETKRNE